MRNKSLSVTFLRINIAKFAQESNEIEVLLNDSTLHLAFFLFGCKSNGDENQPNYRIVNMGEFTKGGGTMVHETRTKQTSLYMLK
jgi:hypothetical protein